MNGDDTYLWVPNRHRKVRTVDQNTRTLTQRYEPSSEHPNRRARTSPTGTRAHLTHHTLKREEPYISPDVFDHRRREDGEHVGHIEMRPDGSFAPYNLLWTPRGEDLELDEAEAVLDEN